MLSKENWKFYDGQFIVEYLLPHDELNFNFHNKLQDAICGLYNDLPL